MPTCAGKHQLASDGLLGKCSAVPSFYEPLFCLTPSLALDKRIQPSPLRDRPQSHWPIVRITGLCAVTGNVSLLSLSSSMSLQRFSGPPVARGFLRAFWIVIYSSREIVAMSGQGDSCTCSSVHVFNPTSLFCALSNMIVSSWDHHYFHFYCYLRRLYLEVVSEFASFQSLPDFLLHDSS